MHGACHPTNTLLLLRQGVARKKGKKVPDTPLGRGGEPAGAGAPPRAREQPPRTDEAPARHLRARCPPRRCRDMFRVHGGQVRARKKVAEPARAFSTRKLTLLGTTRWRDEMSLEDLQECDRFAGKQPPARLKVVAGSVPRARAGPCARAVAALRSRSRQLDRRRANRLSGQGEPGIAHRRRISPGWLVRPPRWEAAGWPRYGFPPAGPGSCAACRSDRNCPARRARLKGDLAVERGGQAAAAGCRAAPTAAESRGRLPPRDRCR